MALDTNRVVPCFTPTPKKAQSSFLMTDDTLKKDLTLNKNTLSAVKRREKKLVAAIRPAIRKKCLSSSHETGLAITVHYTDNVRCVSRATEFCPSEREIPSVLVQADGFLAQKQQTGGG